MQNETLRYEYQFIHFFENKKFKEFSPKWQKHLKRIFPTIEEDTVVHCSKHENYFAKGDIDLRIKNHKVIISLKNGRNPCMHKERFKWFYKTLKDMGVSYQTLNVLTLYQFGESRVFGHQDKPLTKEEIAAQYSDQILKANKELNNEKIIDMVISRGIILGRQEYRQPIDYLYYGNLEKGVLISTDQIKESILSRKELSPNWLHFGQLVFQPACRNREKAEFCDIAIHWPVLAKLFYITKDEDDILSCNIDGQTK